MSSSTKFNYSVTTLHTVMYKTFMSSQNFLGNVHLSSEAVNAFKTFKLNFINLAHSNVKGITQARDI